MKRLLYIHGYNGSPEGHSFRLFSKYVPEGWEVEGMDYTQDDCAKALKEIREKIEQDKIDLVVGSSLGGFLTLLTTGIRRIVINPCYSPSVELPALPAKDGFPLPKPELIATYTAYEPQLKRLAEVDKALITGYFALNDEILHERYLKSFLQDIHDYNRIPGGHHVSEEAVREICENELK